MKRVINYKEIQERRRKRNGHIPDKMTSIEFQALNKKQKNNDIFEQKKDPLEIVYNIVDLLGLPSPVTEYRFHAVRMWRFDAAWPEYKIAVEYEGIVCEKSGHTTYRGYEKDCRKYTNADLLGWKIIRITTFSKQGELIEAFKEAFKV